MQCDSRRDEAAPETCLLAATFVRPRAQRPLRHGAESTLKGSVKAETEKKIHELEAANAPRGFFC
jgi:hypothetical protein